MRYLYAIAMFVLLSGSAYAQPISGRWDGTANVADGLTVPVHLALTGTGAQIGGALMDGEQRMAATAGNWENNTLTLQFAQYAVTLRATLEDGTLRGTYSKDSGTFSYAIALHPHVRPQQSAGRVPKIAGVWIIPDESPKGEHAWRLVVHQNGPDVAATILRIDGDTGTLAGAYHDGGFHLSHFQDTRPALLDITTNGEGALALRLSGPHIGGKPGQTSLSLTALRPGSGKDLPKPDNTSEHTSVKDPHQPFHFRFPDLNGKVVSNTDPQFKNKVVLVDLTGSWCPNCHDEAPSLVELYGKYHVQGFEIVALDFEDAEQKQSLTRLHAFLQKYGIHYTYLLAGDPSEVAEKVPQAVNLNAWPTSFLLGKDGRVRFVETGFPSSGSTQFYDEVRRRFAANIERLLAEAPAARQQ